MPAAGGDEPSVGAAPTSSAEGRMDGVVGGVLTGWAFDAAIPREPLVVEVRGGGRVLGRGRADAFEPRLRDAGLGDGTHGFRIPLEMTLFAGDEVELHLHDARDGRALIADAFTLGLHDPALLAEHELGPGGAHGVPRPHVSVRKRRLRGRVLAIVRPVRRGARGLRRLARRGSRKVRGLVSGPARALARGLGGRRAQAPAPAPAATPAAPEPALAPGLRARLDRLDALASVTEAELDAWPALRLPEHDAPRVSIVIPVHGQFHFTHQCLTSLVLAANATPFEVLLVDDCSTDATRSIEDRVSGLRVIRNPVNLGFLRSCTRGAREARGEYLLFLNNDTEVAHRWLDELCGVFERFADVGAAGSKLVYPDGRLQDAGGIVWETGTPWNAGHGRRPDDPEFDYARDVDYLTGAALMVSRRAWDEVGGFTDAYAPAYYEDTDLAFKLRERGYRTIYCPQSVVVHHEGRSNGTSLESGVKRHQVLNAERFRRTWRARFEGLGAEGQDLRREKDRGRRSRVLVIDHECPRLGRDAGSYAAVSEMRLLVDLGCKVTFLPHNLHRAGTHVDALQRLGIECVHAPWYSSADEFIDRRGREFDLAYITRYQVAERVLGKLRTASDAKIVFNNADLHFLRELRGALARGETDLAGPLETRRRELTVMASVDAVLSYNEIEHEIIASHLMRDDHVFTCPWVLERRALGVPADRRRGLAFLGGFGHPPNREAMDWFIDRVMPLLRAEEPELELHVWGSKLPADTGWEARDGVVVEGWASSLDAVFGTCRVFVAPLRSGAGIKGKVLDAISYEVPTVLSPVAAEATGLVDGLGTLIAESPREWCEAILRLVREDVLWERLSAESGALLERRYSQAHGLERMAEVLDFLGVAHRSPRTEVHADADARRETDAGTDPVRRAA